MFKSTPLFGFILLTLVFLFATRCTSDQVIEMETLERDLLLTWIALEREDQPRIALYNSSVQQDWSLLQGHYGNAPMRPALRQSATRVNLWMLNLRNAVNYQQPKRAMVAINLMQNELRVLRPQLGISNPADLLYDFYYQWQDVVAASNDPMICLLEWNEFEELFEDATKRWQIYLAARPRFSDTLFPGYGQSAQEAEDAALAMTLSLEHFATILEGADHTLTAEPSMMIDDLFFDYLAVVTAYPTQTSPVRANLQ